MTALCLAGSLAACDFERQDRATNAEFRAAMDEVALTGEVASMQDGVIEITTSFTIADGVEAVIAEVQAFVESQVPCSTITSPAARSLQIDFGTLDDACTYRGHTYAGVVTVSFEVGADEVVVTHDYDGLTNGRATMNGQAVVTWRDASRNVVTDFTFEGTSGGTVEVQSDRTQTLVGALGDGIQVDGVRDWTSDRGTWHLDIESVQMRGRDPVPQSGAYSLTNPDDKEFGLAFERLDEDTITVTISAGQRSMSFNVTSSGDVSQE
jgi:hypothetical protein